MSAPVIYRSSDASAPGLSGQAGALISVLDAVLVSGYGSQPSAGWTSSVVGANAKKYIQGGGNGFGCSVNDNGPGAGTFKEARLVGQESGGAFFPTVAQQGAGLILRKSASADALQRQWMIAADDRTFYFFCQTGDTAGVYLAYAFGDFFSLLAADGYRTMCIGRATASENTATLVNDTLDLVATPDSNVATAGHYFARAYTQTGGSVAFEKNGIAAGALNGVMPYPNPTDGGIYLSKVFVTDPTTAPARSRRGYLRGFYQWAHQIGGVIDGDTFTGSAGTAYAGRSFLIVKGTGNAAVYVIETTAWDTSV